MLDPDPDWTDDRIGTAVGANNATTAVAPPKEIYMATAGYFKMVL